MDLYEICVDVEQRKGKTVKLLVNQAIDEGIPVKTILDDGLKNHEYCWGEVSFK